MVKEVFHHQKEEQAHYALIPLIIFYSKPFPDYPKYLFNRPSNAFPCLASSWKLSANAMFYVGSQIYCFAVTRKATPFFFLIYILPF